MSNDGYRKINREFDLAEVHHAIDLASDFEERAAQVANIMFKKRFDIRTNGRSYPLPGTNKVRHEYCNETFFGRPDFTNCALDFPFDWMNKTDEELLAMYDSYWSEFDHQTKEYSMNKNNIHDYFKTPEAYQELRKVIKHVTKVILGRDDLLIQHIERDPKYNQLTYWVQHWEDKFTIGYEERIHIPEWFVLGTTTDEEILEHWKKLHPEQFEEVRINGIPTVDDTSVDDIMHSVAEVAGMLDVAGAVSTEQLVKLCHDCRVKLLDLTEKYWKTKE